MTKLSFKSMSSIKISDDGRRRANQIRERRGAQGIGEDEAGHRAIPTADEVPSGEGGGRAGGVWRRPGDAGVA